MLSVQQQPLLIEHIEEHSVTSPVEFRPLQPSDYLAVKVSVVAPEQLVFCIAVLL